jgi:hypothetical protein
MSDPILTITAATAQALHAHVQAGHCDELDALAWLAADALAVALHPHTSEDTAAQLLDMAGQWATQRQRLLHVEHEAMHTVVPDDCSALDTQP